MRKEPLGDCERRLNSGLIDLEGQFMVRAASFSAIFAFAGVYAAFGVYAAPSSPENSPVLFMPVEIIEPPRDVHAEDWHSPYCLKWNDACQVCGRNTLEEKAACRPMQVADSCDRLPVLCSARDENRFQRMCEIHSTILVIPQEFKSFKLPFSEYAKLPNHHSNTYFENYWEYDNNKWVNMGHPVLSSKNMPLEKI